MSPFANDNQDDDQDLVEFLRQHRLPPPPAAGGLENAIMTKIEGDRDRMISRRWQGWMAAPALAASLVTAVLSYRAFMPPQPTAVEVATLEAFMETNWHNTISDNSDTDLVSTNDE